VVSQLSQPRVAEMVADILRARIVDGELPDGSYLPKQDDLIAEFRVSRPSIREAMRILETEGLISVRRGNVGGAEVHAPQSEPAAQMLGQVMQSRHVPLADVAVALRRLEPACAALCAERDDRAEAVVPVLQRLDEEAATALDDGLAFNEVARRWHEEMVGACGSETLILLVGTVEAIWSRHELALAGRTPAQGIAAERKRRVRTLQAHERVTRAIAAGDARAAERAARSHLEDTQRYLLEASPGALVSVTSVAPPRRR
jgi:DNA-binding FadR family transcriptional regulator